METVDVFLESALFSADIAARTAHRYTKDFFVSVSIAGEGATIQLRPKSTDVDTADLAARVLNDALDDRLRAQVADQTKLIHDVLMGAAFLQSRPTDVST